MKALTWISRQMLRVLSFLWEKTVMAPLEHKGVIWTVLFWIIILSAAAVASLVTEGLKRDDPMARAVTMFAMTSLLLELWEARPKKKTRPPYLRRRRR
jgi:hypothetical protein